MKISKLCLNNFRNFGLAEAEFSDSINIISGQNAQGKTNLLEAVYMLTSGKSFRTRFDRELIRFDRQSAEIAAGISAAEREQTVQILLRRGAKKTILQNGVKKRVSELYGSFTAVLFCPEDLGIIRQGAAFRRRLMDVTISQLRPGYAMILAEYNKLHEHKTRILRDCGEKPSLLHALEEFSEGLLRASAQLIRYRAAFTQRLAREGKKIHSEFAGGGEVLDIVYKTVSTVKNPLAPLTEVYEALREHQQCHYRAERESGLCLTGAHRDDLCIYINEKPAKSFASQGQTRTAALSVKLAERRIFLEETGEYPVLLLDDVLSELDERRQEFVLNRIEGGQTLITCCNSDQIQDKTKGNVLVVENGEIK